MEDLFRILIDARFISHISASGCNLTGTLKHLSSLRLDSEVLNSRKGCTVLRVVQYIADHYAIYSSDICKLLISSNQISNLKLILNCRYKRFSFFGFNKQMDSLSLLDLSNNNIQHIEGLSSKARIMLSLNHCPLDFAPGVLTEAHRVSFQKGTFPDRLSVLFPKTLHAPQRSRKCQGYFSLPPQDLFSKSASTDFSAFFERWTASRFGESSWFWHGGSKSPNSIRKSNHLRVSLDGGFLCKAVENKMDLDLRNTRLANFDESFEIFEEGKLHFTPGLSWWNRDRGAEGLGLFSRKLEWDPSSKNAKCIVLFRDFPRSPQMLPRGW